MSSSEREGDARTRLEGPGRRLRRARERRKLSAAEVGEALHLDRRTVEALEEEDFARLPPVTFTRGYLRSYARLMGVPENEVLDAVDHLGMERRARPLTATVGNTPRPEHAPVGKPLAGAVLTLLVLAGGGWWLWDSGLVAALIAQIDGVESADVGDGSAPQRGDDTVPPARESVPEAGNASEPAPQNDANTGLASGGPAAERAAGASRSAATDSGIAAGDGAGAPAPGTSARQKTAGGASARPTATLADDAAVATGSGADETAMAGDDRSVDSADVGGALASAAPPPAASNPAGEPGAAPAASDGEGADVGGIDDSADAANAGPSERLTFEFSGKSWMEVRDGDGQTLMRGLVDENGERRLRGKPPFSIVIGDVRQVRLRQDGEVIDLDPYSRGQVAKFTLDAAE